MVGDSLPALLISRPATARDATEAAALAGLRIARTIDWPDVGAQIGRQAGRALLMVEADGVDDDLLAASLPVIDRHAAATDAPMIACFKTSQIDAVTAGLFGRQVQWLCEPSLAERVGAMAIASECVAAAGSFHDVSRETETVRLHRLNEEVARIAQVLSRLTREEPMRSGDDGRVSERRMTFGTQPIVGESPVDAADVRKAIRSRRMRDQFFRHGLFEDPAWDMLLDLFAAELEHGQVSVSSLCIAAAVAPTTALRWIGKLADGGLVERQPDPFDRRRAFMALSETARAGMLAYCAAVKNAGLAIA